jgi:hypothetical protein
MENSNTKVDIETVTPLDVKRREPAMKINLLFRRLLTVSYFVILAGCSPKPEAPSQTLQAAEPAPAPAPEEVTTGPHQERGDRKPLLDLPHAKIRIQRGFLGPGKFDTSETIEAMNLILNEWKPIGRKVEEVKSFMGRPSRIENDIIIYAFDTGELHYEWFLHVNDGMIASVSTNHNLE